jgi:ribosomal protein L32
MSGESVGHPHVMECPHCGKLISVGVMCADCADAISTNLLYDGLFGNMPPHKARLFVAGVCFVGFALLGVALVLLLGW